MFFFLTPKQKKQKFMAKESMAEASKLGIGAESLFFEKVIAFNIVLHWLQWNTNITTLCWYSKYYKDYSELCGLNKSALFLGAESTAEFRGLWQFLTLFGHLQSRSDLTGWTCAVGLAIFGVSGIHINLICETLADWFYVAIV